MPIVKKRLMQAGVRLAVMLDLAYSGVDMVEMQWREKMQYLSRLQAAPAYEW